ncbi:MAG TPA: hypothetical protein DCQ31_11360, partial [Bacteroidales bacterium]|nr:hypothetical protein [Bacteroidales bacterium]
MVQIYNLNRIKLPFNPLNIFLNNVLTLFLQKNTMKKATKAQTETTSNTIIIVPKEKIALSKNQQVFNKLTKRIEFLETDILKETNKLNNLLSKHRSLIKPIYTEIANEQFGLAMLLAKQLDHIKFSKKQTEKINNTIIQLCQEAFQHLEPTEDQEAFYNSRSQSSYKDELDEQTEAEKEMINRMFSNMFDEEFDFSELENNPEKLFEFQERMREKMEAKEAEANANRKKSKKQMAAEEKQKQEDAIAAKSIRSIYIALAKILHPDNETDPELKLEKEELMKKVVVAYENKDLPALLKMEIEFVHKQSEFMDKLTDEKLQIYISVLKQQVQELESERFQIRFNPRFSEINGYVGFSEKQSELRFAYELDAEKRRYKMFKKIYKSVEKNSDKKLILNFIDEYYEQEDDFDFLN